MKSGDNLLLAIFVLDHIVILQLLEHDWIDVLEMFQNMK
jgi:hypothetical protein